MQKTFILLMTFLFSLPSFAQSNTLVMIEEGTQASCPPCAQANPDFDALLAENSDKVVVLKYQTSWPGFDQMNLDNPVDVADRVAYYGITGVPQSFMNGSPIGGPDGWPLDLTQAMIDDAYNVIAPLTMEITGEVLNGELIVSGSITADDDVSGDLRLRIAVTEKEITSNEAPGGTNGETEYFHVMKSFIGGTDGFSLSDMAAGDTYEFSESLFLGSFPIYDLEDLEIVSFVQDDNTSAIFQAAKDPVVDVSVNVANNVDVTVVSNMPAFACSGETTINPSVTIVNNGSDELTSANIVYTANGVTETYEWTGSLDTYESEEVELDIDLTIGGSNMVQIETNNPNGSADEGANNIVSGAIPSYSYNTAGAEMVLTMVTDIYGSELTIEVLDPSDNVLFTGTGYPDQVNETIVVDMSDVEFAESGCHQLRLYDTYGDGVSLGGSVELLLNGEVIYDDATFGIGDIDESAPVNGYSINDTRIFFDVSFTELVIPTASINANNTDNAYSFAGSSDDAAAEYAWVVNDADGNQVSMGSGADFDYTFEANGEYTVVLTVTGTSGGMNTSEQAVNITSIPPVVTLGEVTTIPGGGIQSYSTSVSSDDPDAQYTWEITNDAGVVTSGNTSDIAYNFVDNGDYVLTVTTTGNNQQVVVSTYDIEITEATNVGIDDLVGVNGVGLFPVPAQDQLTVQLDLVEAQNMTISVANILGETVEVLNQSRFNAGENTVQVNTSAYSNGVYFINIETANGVAAQRFVVSK